MFSNARDPRKLGQRQRVDRVDDLRLAVDDFVDAVGGGDALLQLIEFLREAAGRVGHAGEHREEHAHLAVSQRRRR